MPLGIVGSTFNARIKPCPGDNLEMALVDTLDLKGPAVENAAHIHIDGPRGNVSDRLPSVPRGQTHRRTRGKGRIRCIEWWAALDHQVVFVLRIAQTFLHPAGARLGQGRVLSCCR